MKRETHVKFDKLLPPHAIITTNTSGLLVSDIDRAWMINQGAKAGPFGMMDFVG